MTQAPIDTVDRVLRQPGRVLRVQGGQALVATDPVAGCGGCAVSGGCAAKALAEMRGRKTSELCLPVSDDFRPGQAVVVQMPSSDFLKAAFFALLLPALAFVTSIWLSTLFALPLFPAIVLSGAGVLASLWPLWRAERTGRLVENLRVGLPEPADETK